LPEIPSTPIGQVMRTIALAAQSARLRIGIFADAGVRGLLCAAAEEAVGHGIGARCSFVPSLGSRGASMRARARLRSANASSWHLPLEGTHGLRVVQRLIRFARLVLVAAPMGMLASAAAQAPATPRVALVLGNGAYAAAPLATPAKDAGAVGEVLRGLGFTVIEARDATKAQMEAAIVRTQETLKGGSAIGLLYYSGYGLQLGWRNYLIPVDAKLSGAKDVPANTIEVQRIFDAFQTAGSRMNIFVFEACREHPFSASASGRGLAQMDAPPESILAFATSPGEAADDVDAGQGHSLYTHHLLRELQQPGAKIEDVFKRVRFWVRRQSEGRQVPWESTSLEGDFHFDPRYRAPDLLGEGATSDPVRAAPRNALASGGGNSEDGRTDFVVGGVRFVGTFIPDEGESTYSGVGQVTWPNGGRFDGVLVKGKRQNLGAFTWSSGQRYEGEWNEDQPHGRGSMWFANGEHFEGEFVAGEPNGQGRMRFASGDRFTGPVLRGVPHGRGTYTWPNGQSLSGEWVDGKVRGSGVLRFANDDLYEGELMAGLPNGEGRILFASGDSYSGTFKDGLASGSGVYLWKDGTKHTGQWKAGAKHGPAVITWPNGDRWEGSFQDNAMLDGVLTKGSN
jgi:hypothetical protein